MRKRPAYQVVCHVFPLKTVSRAIVMLFLGACSSVPPVPAATTAGMLGTVNAPPSPTESLFSVQPTGTSPAPSPITLSNFQRLLSLNQWNLDADVVDITGVALSPRAEEAALLVLRYPEQYSL